MRHSPRSQTLPPPPAPTRDQLLDRGLIAFALQLICIGLSYSAATPLFVLLWTAVSLLFLAITLSHLVRYLRA